MMRLLVTGFEPFGPWQLYRGGAVFVTDLGDGIDRFDQKARFNGEEESLTV